MARSIRVGVIGTGFGSWCIVPAWEATEGCEVVGHVTPRDDDAVAELCARDDVDVISIHSPPFLHLEHVRRASAAGHAILCDKPFGLDARESEQMCALADAAGIPNFLNFERRFDAGRQQVRRLISDGVIGRPDHFQWARLIKMPRPRTFGWLCQSELGGGWMPAQGSHLIDYCRWMFGEVVEATMCRRITVPELPDHDGKPQRCDAEDGFVVTLATASGVTAVIDSTIDRQAREARRTVLQQWRMHRRHVIHDDVLTRPRRGGGHLVHRADHGGAVPPELEMRRSVRIARVVGCHVNAFCATRAAIHELARNDPPQKEIRSKVEQRSSAVATKAWQVVVLPLPLAPVTMTI